MGSSHPAPGASRGGDRTGDHTPPPPAEGESVRRRRRGESHAERDSPAGEAGVGQRSRWETESGQQRLRRDPLRALSVGQEPPHLSRGRCSPHRPPSTRPPAAGGEGEMGSPMAVLRRGTAGAWSGAWHRPTRCRGDSGRLGWGIPPPTPQCSDTGTPGQNCSTEGPGDPGLTTPCDSPSPEPLHAAWGRRAKRTAKPRCQPADGDGRTTGVPGRSARFHIPLKHEQATEVRRGAAEKGGSDRLLPHQHPPAPHRPCADRPRRDAVVPRGPGAVG